MMIFFIPPEVHQAQLKFRLGLGITHTQIKTNLIVVIQTF